MSSSSTRRAAQIDTVLEKFRSRGGRITTARRQIVAALLAGPTHRHFSAEEIATTVQAGSPELATSTVYRSLEALEDLGVLEHIHVGHGPAIYHLADQHHLHLVCKRCNIVIEMPDATLTALGKEIRRRHGFAIEPRHNAINGLCANCLAET